MSADAVLPGDTPVSIDQVMAKINAVAESVQAVTGSMGGQTGQETNLSRLIERLVEAGLVRREVCPTDKRGQMLFITDAGKKARKATWPYYARAVNKHLGDKLSEAETEKLAALLGKLIEKS